MAANGVAGRILDGEIIDGWILDGRIHGRTFDIIPRTREAIVIDTNDGTAEAGTRCIVSWSVKKEDSGQKFVFTTKEILLTEDEGQTVYEFIDDIIRHVMMRAPLLPRKRLAI